jgi:hypothetical protein
MKSHDGASGYELATAFVNLKKIWPLSQDFPKPGETLLMSARFAAGRFAIFGFRGHIFGRAESW